MVEKTIFSVSRREERPETVAYYGAPGSMAHQAAEEQFGSEADYEPAASLEEIFDWIAGGRVHFGVVPPEISREGIVTHSFEFVRINNLDSKGSLVGPMRLLGKRFQALCEYLARHRDRFRAVALRDVSPAATAQSAQPRPIVSNRARTVARIASQAVSMVY